MANFDEKFGPVPMTSSSMIRETLCQGLVVAVLCALVQPSFVKYPGSNRLSPPLVVSFVTLTIIVTIAASRSFKQMP